MAKELEELEELKKLVENVVPDMDVDKIVQTLVHATHDEFDKHQNPDTKLTSVRADQAMDVVTMYAINMMALMARDLEDRTPSEGPDTATFGKFLASLIMRLEERATLALIENASMNMGNKK